MTDMGNNLPARSIRRAAIVGRRAVDWPCVNYADRVKTRCSAATDALQVTKDYERHRVTPRIALIDRVGALSGTTRYVQPGRSDQAQMVGLLSPARLSLPPSICQMR